MTDSGAPTSACDQCGIKTSNLRMGGGDCDNMCRACWEKEGRFMILERHREISGNAPLDGFHCLDCLESYDEIEQRKYPDVEGSFHFGYCYDCVSSNDPWFS